MISLHSMFRWSIQFLISIGSVNLPVTLTVMITVHITEKSIEYEPIDGIRRVRDFSYYYQTIFE